MKNYDVELGCGTILTFADLEAAGLSYVPCARLPSDSGLEDKPLFSFGNLWGGRKQVTLASYSRAASAWSLARWERSEFPGVQIMTGKPSFRADPLSADGFSYAVDLDIEARLIENYPEVFDKLLSIYRSACVGTPCEIETKSGGRRLSLFTPGYDKKISFQDKNALPDDNKTMLFEFCSLKSLSRIDARYKMLSGSLLDIPDVAREALREIRDLVSEVGFIPNSNTGDAEVVERSQIGDLNIRWSADGRSQLFPTACCQVTHHKSNRNEVRFFKSGGGVLGLCHNCGGRWWEKKPFVVGVNAPVVDVREKSSFPHFSKEEKIVVNQVLSVNADAGWHGKTPVFTTAYKYLHPLTHKFKLNGQPSDVEKRRVWSTLFGTCDVCGGITAEWVDRYLLTAGRYCDGCHKDYGLGSYLEIELSRKLPNSVVSDYQGFLGDDVEFADFRLWSPGMLTHLGAGMSTGKSTEIYKAMVSLARQGLGRGIIAVPRISLARFLAYQLRARYGFEAWGLWHEGSGRYNQFIGSCGAIVCLPSLPRAVSEATDNGVSRLYLAVDELDFSYDLMSLVVENAPAVKKCLRDALSSTGLVVSGQTESTLAIEALAEELGCEQMQGYYNTASVSDGAVVLKRHSDSLTKVNSVLAGVIDDVSDALNGGYNAYCFVASRRDGDIVADEFADVSPVVYNAYTKGMPCADAVLKNQRLTGDARLFIGTSAAGVGISVLDDKARTIIGSGLNYGSRDANMLAQFMVRDRGRRGVSLHYVNYDFRLPVKPSVAGAVSIYHEALKAVENKKVSVSAGAAKKSGYAKALSMLADAQLPAFINYHLGVVGNMPVNFASALPVDELRIDAIAGKRRELITAERDKKLSAALGILRSQNLLSSREIRVKSNTGDMTKDLRLAYEAANGYARAVGWLDIEDNPFSDADDIDAAVGLCSENVNFDVLEKQRRGYMAVRFPNWTRYEFDRSLKDAENAKISDGLGVELSAVVDDRFLGVLLTALLDALKDTLFNETSLAGAVRDVLLAERDGVTLLGELCRGALGVSEMRKARFLAIADDTAVVQWIRSFIKEWYPAGIGKRNDTYALQFARHIFLILASFSRWLANQKSVPDDANIELGLHFTPTQLPDPNSEKREKARKMRGAGETLKRISEDLEVGYHTAQRWCKGVDPDARLRDRALKLKNKGLSSRKVAFELGISRRKLDRVVQNRA